MMIVGLFPFDSVQLQYMHHVLLVCVCVCNAIMHRET